MMIDIPVLEVLTVGMLPSFLKRYYYRLRGAKIGKQVHFRMGSVLVGKEIRVDDGCRFGFFSIVMAERIHIGKRADIGSFTILSAREISIDDDAIVHELVFSGILEGPRSVLRIGKRARIFPLSVINASTGLTIEDDVGIGFCCLIFTHGVWQSVLQGYPVKYAPVTIGKGAWLAADVMVLPGVTIGEGATVGAKALVMSDVPARSLAFGLPAKVIRSGSEYLKPISLEEKEEILKRIFREFAENFSYKGPPTKFEESGSSYAVRVGGRQDCVIRYVKSSAEMNAETGATQILVSLTKLPDEFVREMEKQQICWIDLENESRGTATNHVMEEFVDFLFRYGIKAIKIDQLST